MTINGHKFSLGNVLTVLGMLAGLGGVWGTLSADNADTKRRVIVVEERVKEDRRDARQSVNELKEHVKAIDQNTQLILQKISAMEASAKAERRGQR